MKSYMCKDCYFKDKKKYLYICKICYDGSEYQEDFDDELLESPSRIDDTIRTEQDVIDVADAEVEKYKSTHWILRD
jgi:hypothetical protein